MSARVSVIVTTRNNHDTLDACLRSIQDQTYDNFELIVVDNNSTDDTREIAAKYTGKVYAKGPERSAQRNFAATKATGVYLLVIDSDMELSPEVVAQCVAKAEADGSISAIIIPEESFGKGFWAQCKKMERSYYVGQDAIEAARFFRKTDFDKAGGYNEALTGGEDWDLTKCMKTLGRHDRIAAFIYHNEGRPRFSRTVKKMYYYGSHAADYFAANPTQSALTDQSGPLQRYKLFLSRPGKLLRNPLVGIGMLTLKTAEYVAGGLGMVASKAKAREVTQ
jgi:glycosyltransferase involved in cell wall biosynthesis